MPIKLTMPLWVLEGALLYFVIWLALRFSLPGETFGTAPQSYKPFLTLGSEGAWGLGLGLVALVSGGLFMAGRWGRIAASFILACCHLVLALLFVSGNPQGMAAGLYGGIAALGFYAARRAARGTA